MKAAPQRTTAALAAVFVLLVLATYLSSSAGSSGSLHRFEGVDTSPDSLDSTESDPQVPDSRSHAMPAAAKLDAACAVPLRFLSWEEQRSHSTGLASFPGSGNTWLRFLVEQGTRVYTGSVYNDGDLNTTYRGEGSKDARVIAVKTHYPCPNCWTYQRCAVCGATYPVTSEMTGPVKGSDSQVFLLRSPFDAMLAEFKRLTTGKHNGELDKSDFTRTPFRGHFSSHYDRPTWQEFINQRLVAYAKAARHYLDRPTTAVGPKDVTPLVEGAVRVPDLHAFAQSDRFVARPGSLTKLVFYEKLVKDPTTELVKIFAFFNDLYTSEGKKSVLPLRDAAMAAKCAMQHYKQAESQQWKRKVKKFNPWTPAQVKQVCNALGKWWFEDIWGPCLEGKLQWQRASSAQDGE